jgi:rhamnosyl/mannosyltransferase
METHVQTLARAQAGLGVEVRVVCVNHRDRRGRDVTWDGLARTTTAEEVDGAVRVTRLGRWGAVARLEVCPGLPVLLGRLRGGVDVLHLHAPNPTMVLALVASRWRGPLVITHHSDVIRQQVLRWLQGPFDRRLYRRAAYVLADSPAYVEGSEVLQEHAAKVRVLPLGIRLADHLAPGPAAQAHARKLRQEYGWPLWLCVGRLVYYKGLHNAIEALDRVPGTLLVIGTGPLGQQLRELARARGVAGRIAWQGWAGTNELIGAYHAATALWFPSNARSEGFGLVQVEAMASGCPVINTAVPGSGVAWVSRHGESGLTVPVNDPAALAAAAKRLLAEPGLRQQLARNARHRVEQVFDHLLMARRSVDLYHQVLGRPTPNGSDRVNGVGLSVETNGL